PVDHKGCLPPACPSGPWPARWRVERSGLFRSRRRRNGGTLPREGDPIMGMVLYEMAMSPNAKRARLGLAETGAPFERREVNLLAGEQKTAGYKAIHPLRRGPTLDDDGVVVWESGAILLYLADKFPEARLMPRGLAERGHVYQWLTFGETSIHGYLGPMGFQMFRRAPEKRDQQVLERGRQRMPE